MFSFQMVWWVWISASFELEKLQIPLWKPDCTKFSVLWFSLVKWLWLRVHFRILIVWQGVVSLRLVLSRRFILYKWILILVSYHIAFFYAPGFRRWKGTNFQYHMSFACLLPMFNSCCSPPLHVTSHVQTRKHQNICVKIAQRLLELALVNYENSSSAPA